MSLIRATQNAVGDLCSAKLAAAEVVTYKFHIPPGLFEAVLLGVASSESVTGFKEHTDGR